MSEKISLDSSDVAYFPSVLFYAADTKCKL